MTMPDASVTHAAIFGAAALKVGSKMARAESGVNAQAGNPAANERQEESPHTTKFSAEQILFFFFHAEQILSFKVLPEDLPGGDGVKTPRFQCSLSCFCRWWQT